MIEYIFFTTEGYTYPPKEGIEIENCQILGRESGNSLEEAKDKLIKNRPWIRKSGFDEHEILHQQILSDEYKIRIENQLSFLTNLLDKKQLEEYTNWLILNDI